MKCSKCGKECVGLSGTVDIINNQFVGDVVNSDCCGSKVVLVEGIPNNDWKDLEIKCIPTDILEADYQIERVSGNIHNNQKLSKQMFFSEIFTALGMGNVTNKYRYRLKPLESMKVTQRIYDMLYHELIVGSAYSGYKAYMDGDDMIVDNCKVELNAKS